MKYPQDVNLYNTLASYAYSDSMALDATWCNLDRLGKDIDYSELVSQNFLLKKEIFFFIVKTLMQQGCLRLAKNSNFLTDSIEEQVALFEKAFPDSEEAMDNGIWFFNDECPAGAVWVHQLADGSEHLEWT